MLSYDKFLIKIRTEIKCQIRANMHSVEVVEKNNS